MNSATLVGGTGLVGSQILSALQTIPQKPTIYAIARREIPSVASNTKPVIESQSTTWPDKLKSLEPTPEVFISALGTTRAQAGSLDAQRAIDYDLNLALAKAAKDSGTKTYVLISSAAVSAKSRLPYSKMKGELEDAVKALEFPHTIIIKPGLLVGSRQDTRVAEAMLRTVAKGLGSISKGWLTDWWAQDVDVIGRAAVAAALECSEGKREEGLWIVGQADIVRMGSRR
ncbi:MAG: hypothetical protein LQ337_002281 [Flavoplaca oasis]|nr:MAG: hypothetical protein LQ337_002281 [Flavoplaca oasis]